MDMQSVSIIGIGRLGGALAIALSRAGYVIDNLVHRDPSTANSISQLLPSRIRLVSWSSLPPRLGSDVILITTPDPQIAVIAGVLVKRLDGNAIVLHSSGSLSSDVLSALATAGHSTGSMHPLISVSDAPHGADHFANAYFCIEGDDAATEAARSIVSALGGRAFTIDPARKALYHAAAVITSGHFVALIDLAVEMLSRCGIDRKNAQEILLPLVSTTVDNLGKGPPAAALTGSFARADIDAVRRHLAAIDDAAMSPAIRDIYLLLGERSLDLAAANGASVSEVQNLREAISIAKRKPG
jgi:predicted short-subunit dehydrogenase-like oxidoreductase (DUF2520 family)